MASEYPFRPIMTKVFWKDVSKEVHKIAPEFAKLIDAIDPGKDYPIYKACYPYGSLIVKEGVCYYPNTKGELVTLDDPSLNANIKEDLIYADVGLPAGMVITNTIELFIPTTERIYPWKIFPAGYIFALWKFLEKRYSTHPYEIFNMTSGIRSIFLLPNIGNTFNHKNLRREFGIKLSPPKDLFSQWELFTAITANQKAKCNWHSEVLYFSKKWLEKLHSNDNKWIHVSAYLLQISWIKSEYTRNKIFYDFLFSRIQATRHLKPNPYIADTTKHVLAIAIGALPGFAPSIDNHGAPIEILQKTFIDVYNIKKYAITFFEPHWFKLYSKERPVYYSLSSPSSLEFSPHCRKVRTTLYDLRDLAHLLQIYLEEIQKNTKLKSTPMYYVAKNVKFDYFHDKYDYEGYTNYTKEMPKFDTSLIQCPRGYNNNIFPQAANFLRGCVRISLLE